MIMMMTMMISQETLRISVHNVKFKYTHTHAHAPAYIRKQCAPSATFARFRSSSLLSFTQFIQKHDAGVAHFCSRCSLEHNIFKYCLTLRKAYLSSGVTSSHCTQTKIKRKREREKSYLYSCHKTVREKERKRERDEAKIRG